MKPVVISKSNLRRLFLILNCAYCYGAFICKKEKTRSRKLKRRALAYDYVALNDLKFLKIERRSDGSIVIMLKSKL